jgi:hypothetical protein
LEDHWNQNSLFVLGPEAKMCEILTDMEINDVLDTIWREANTGVDFNAEKIKWMGIWLPKATFEEKSEHGFH